MPCPARSQALHAEQLNVRAARACDFNRLVAASFAARACGLNRVAAFAQFPGGSQPPPRRTPSSRQTASSTRTSPRSTSSSHAVATESPHLRNFQVARNVNVLQSSSRSAVAQLLSSLDQDQDRGFCLPNEMITHNFRGGRVFRLCSYLSVKAQAFCAGTFGLRPAQRFRRRKDVDIVWGINWICGNIECGSDF